MSVRAFAYLIGTSRTYVQHWFTGQKPSLKMMTKVRMFTNSEVNKFQELLEPGRMEFNKYVYKYRKRVYKSKKKKKSVSRKSLIPNMVPADAVDSVQSVVSGE